MGAGIAQLVVLGLAVHGVAGSILLWGHFPVEGIFPLELRSTETEGRRSTETWPADTAVKEKVYRDLAC